MKKDNSLTVRVETKISDIIFKLAKKDDRSIAYVIRSLIIEALEARGLLKSDKKKKS